MFRRLSAVSGEEGAKYKTYILQEYQLFLIFRCRVTRVVKEFDVQLP